MRQDIVPPQDLEAEMSVLCAMTKREDVLFDIRGLLTTDDFYRQEHRTLWRCICDLADRHEPADDTTIRAELRKHGQWENVGQDYLWAVLDSVPAADFGQHYAEIVKDRSRRRQMAELGAQLQAAAYDMERPVSEALSAHGSDVARLMQGRTERLVSAYDVAYRVSDRLQAVCADPASSIGIDLGIVELDDLLGGVEPGDLVIIGARTSKGKSALAMQFSSQVARWNPTLVATLEMSANQVMLREVSARSAIQTPALRRGTFDQERWDVVVEALAEVGNSHLWFLEGGAVEIGRFQAEIRRAALKIQAHAGKPLGLLTVDHLGFVGAPGDSRVVAIGNAVLGIKTVARDLGVPVLLAVQLSRKSEDDDRAPMLTDLRESGHIEEHADAVILIHNPDARAGRPSDKPCKARLILAKHRNGMTGTVDVMWDGTKQRFYPMEAKR